MTKNEDESESKDEFFPVKVPMSLIHIMDEFVKVHPELAVVSRNELARRAISEWILTKRKELEELSK